MRRLFSRRPARLDADAVVLDDFYRSLLLHVEPESLYTSVVARLGEIAGCRDAALFLVEPTRGDLRLHAAIGACREVLAETRFEQGQGLARWLAINECPLLTARDTEVVEDLPEPERSALEKAGAEVIVPLEAASRLIGFIALAASEQRWSEELVARMATLAVPAALAFEHAVLVRDEEQRLRHLYRAERLATAGTIAAGLAHEIRNPLTAVRTGMQMLRDRDEMPADAAEVLGDVVHEVDRIDRLVESLLMFARAPRSEPTQVDLADLARRAVSLLAGKAHKAGTELVLQVPERPVFVLGDAGELEQVLLNLLLNAIEATGEGQVRLSLHAEAAQVVLEVLDQGPGLPAADLERAFDPFFTTKPEGSGLGLPISYAIVRRHGGDLTLANGAAGGAVARVVLPLLGTRG